MGKRGYTLPTPWEQAIGGWLSWLKLGGISDQTLRLRRGHVRVIARRSNTAGPPDVTRGMLQTLCTQYRWSNDHRKGLRTSLSSFYEWCIVEGLATDNIALSLPKVKESTPRPKPAPDGIWDELLAAAPLRERIMALLAGEAGLRRGEVAQVHTDDIMHDVDGWSLVVHGKGDKQRIVPLTDRLANEIDYYLLSPGGVRRRGFLFPGQIDGHLSAGHVGVVISRLMPPGWSMHKLRHRFATRGYNGTKNIRAVQEVLGHASVATTQRYTATTRDDIRGVTEAASRSRHGGNDVA